MPFKDPEKRREYAAKYRAANRTSEVGSIARKHVNAKREKRSVTSNHRFVGVDGEGYTDAFGRHHYITLSIKGGTGSGIPGRTLYTGKPL
jgi:hypothetical protein